VAIHLVFSVTILMLAIGERSTSTLESLQLHQEIRMTLDPRAIQIHADGSVYRNPGHVSGCAVIARYPEHLNRDDEIIVDFGCPRSTNQRMELTACIEALKWVRRNAPWDGVTCVLVITDATYVTEFIGLAPTWKRNGWRNQYGQPILNSDLWDDLLKARAKAGIRVDFVWQAGKTTEIGNRVDRMAKAAAKRGGMDKDTGYKPGAYCRSMVKVGVALPYPATGQVAIIRPYAKKPVSKLEERLSFNIFNEETQTYESKFYAFATRMLAYELHRPVFKCVLLGDSFCEPGDRACRILPGHRNFLPLGHLSRFA
jgi:ribonuclease HI